MRLTVNLCYITVASASLPVWKTANINSQGAGSITFLRFDHSVFIPFYSRSHLKVYICGLLNYDLRNLAPQITSMLFY